MTANFFASFQVLNKQLKAMTKEVNLCRDLLGGGAGRLCGGEEQALMEDTLEGLQERMGLLDSTLEPLCDSMKDSLQEHSTFQVQSEHSDLPSRGLVNSPLACCAQC